MLRPSTDIALDERVNRVHLRSRLGIEDEREARVLGQGRGLLHIENWIALHKLIRRLLRLVGLLGRGRRNARSMHDARCRANPPPMRTTRGLPVPCMGCALVGSRLGLFGETCLRGWGIH